MFTFMDCVTFDPAFESHHRHIGLLCTKKEHQMVLLLYIGAGGVCLLHSLHDCPILGALSERHKYHLRSPKNDPPDHFYLRSERLRAYGVPKKALFFGERRNRYTRTRRTDRIRLPSSASDDDGTVAFESHHRHYLRISATGVPLLIILVPVVYVAFIRFTTSSS